MKVITRVIASNRQTNEVTSGSVQNVDPPLSPLLDPFLDPIWTSFWIPIWTPFWTLSGPSSGSLFGHPSGPPILFFQKIQAPDLNN